MTKVEINMAKLLVTRNSLRLVHVVIVVLIIEPWKL